MNWQDYITSDPEILFGKPVVKGTRIPVDLILEKLGNQHRTADLLRAYPRLTEGAVQACLLFASEAMWNEIVYTRASKIKS